MSQTVYALGIIVSFGLIVGLVVRRFNYGVALGAGSLLLGIFFGLSFEGFSGVILSTLVDQVTLELALVVVLIPILALSMKETGLVSEFIEELAGILSPRAILAVIPAMFGMLPMLGGALLSAPLIDKEADRQGLNAVRKSLINVWFRHSWFGVSPISSALILTARLTGVGLYDLILVNIPISVVQTIIGYFFFILPIKRGSGSMSRTGSPHSHRILVKSAKCFAPIVMIVVLNILGMPLVAALAIGVGVTMVLGRVGFSKVAYLLRHGFSIKMVLAILGVMFFRHMIQDSGAISFLTSTLQRAGISQLAFLTIIPIAFGIITANPSAVISVNVPLALPLFSKITPPLVSILYQSSLFAYNFSPLHLCLIVTIGYYNAGLGGVYRWLIPLWVAVYIIGLSINLVLLRVS